MFLSVFFLPLFPAFSLAAEPETLITSDSLEYFHETKTYVAKGSVEVKKEDAVITADEMTYHEATSDIIAQGKVRYKDTDVSMKAEKAELNLETKTGKLFDADIFSAKEHYYISGKEVEKKAENAYYSPSASITTCDAPVPAWCFRGKNVDAVLGDQVKARDASFRIKNVPVLYTPYLLAPLLAKRQTGLLMPSISQSESRGFGLKIPFFWVISENRDATFVLDTYSKRGIGQGLEYRYVQPDGLKGEWWLYHIRDRELDKDFWEFKALHENRYPGGFGGFLNINLLSEEDFYREYSSQLQTRAQRFLESTGEFNVPLNNSRLYLLSQYWIDLKNDTEDVSQRLPEAGYVLNYSKFGPSLFSASLTAANMWRDGGLSAGRMDFYPKLLHSFGRDFTVSQTAAVRATAYSFYRDDSVADSSVQRTAFEYDVVGHTRLYKRYGTFLHVLEPTIGYHFISSSENDLPVFDVTEVYKKTSLIELSLLNRLISKGNEVATVRLTQEIDTYNGDEPFLPLKLELGMNRWVPLRLEATYDVNSGMIETVNYDLSLNILKAGVTFGQTYNREEDIMVYKASAAFSPHKNISISSSIWYDAKGGGLRDLNVSMRYLRQCWGLRFDWYKTPEDYTMLVLFELAGVNMKPSTDNKESFPQGSLSDPFAGR
jgi:LPS-assembly protein